MSVPRIVGGLRAAGRRWGLGRRPLRRPIDRLQNLAAALLTLIVLAVIPLGLTTGQSVYHHQLATAFSQSAQRHQVNALLLRDAAPAADGRGASTTILTPARWQLSDGTMRIGEIDTRPGLPAGSVIPIWIDTTGAPTSQPLTAWQAAWQGGLAGTGVILVAAAAASTLFNLLRWRLDRRRSADWDVEWAQVGPLWSRHPR